MSAKPSTVLEGSCVAAVHVHALVKGGVFLHSSCFFFSGEEQGVRNMSHHTRVAVWFRTLARLFMSAAAGGTQRAEAAWCGAGGSALADADLCKAVTVSVTTSCWFVPSGFWLRETALVHLDVPTQPCWLVSVQLSCSRNSPDADRPIVAGDWSHFTDSKVRISAELPLLKHLVNGPGAAA